jgi:hypothetical protein
VAALRRCGAAASTRAATLNYVAAAADEVPADTDVAWTGRTMKVPWFAEHMRSRVGPETWGRLRQLLSGY